MQWQIQDFFFPKGTAILRGLPFTANEHQNMKVGPKGRCHYPKGRRHRFRRDRLHHMAPLPSQGAPSVSKGTVTVPIGIAIPSQQAPSLSQGAPSPSQERRQCFKRSHHRPKERRHRPDGCPRRFQGRRHGFQRCCHRRKGSYHHPEGRRRRPKGRSDFG